MSLLSLSSDYSEGGRDSTEEKEKDEKEENTQIWNSKFQIGNPLLSSPPSTPKNLMTTLAYLEEFALATEREAVLARLTPQTEPHDYYALLRLQAARPHAGEATDAEWAEEEALVRAVTEKRNPSARLARLLFQHRLRRRERGDDSRALLGELARAAGASLSHHRREAAVRNAGNPHPNAFDNTPLENASLEALLAKSQGLPAFRDTPEANAFLCRASGRLSDRQLDELLGRLRDPLVAPGLVPMVAANLEKRQFGQHEIHTRLTAAQLDELLRERPSLQTSLRFVEARLALMPGAADHRHKPTQRASRLADMLAYVRGLGPRRHPSLELALLHERLRVESEEAGVYDFAAFEEYLRVPRNSGTVSAELSRRHAGEQLARLGQSFSCGGVPPVRNDTALVERFLRRHFEDPRARDISRFAELVSNDLLRLVLARTKAALYGGAAPVTPAAAAPAATDAEERERARWLAQLDEAEAGRSRDEVLIEFDPRNRRRFAAADGVSVALTAKNAGRVSVRVFEVNARARNVRASSVELEGLTPHLELAVDLSAISPHARVPVLVPLPQLAGRRGAFVVDVIGNGKNARALVRKGRLAAVERRTVAGHVFRLVDETMAPAALPARMRIDGRAYEADAGGEILVPYSSSLAGARRAELEAGDGAADLAEVNVLGESFSFSAGLHVDREALLEKRGEAAVVVRASLQLNGRAAPLKMLRSVRVSVQSTDSAGIRSSTDGAVDLAAAAGTASFPFPVPDRLRSVAVVLTAEVRRASDGGTERFREERSFEVNGEADTPRVVDVHLRRDPDGSFALEVLGTGGEPRAAFPVAVRVRHRLLAGDQPAEQTLQTDARGRVALGLLAGADAVTAHIGGASHRTFALAATGGGVFGGGGGGGGNSAAGGVWSRRLPPHYPPEVTVAQGEAVSLAYAGAGAPGDVTLVRHAGPNLNAEDHTARHLEVDADGGFVRVSADLPAGEYTLAVRSAPAEVRLTSVAGQVVFGRYAVSDERVAELSRRAGPPLRVWSVRAAPGGGLAVRLAGGFGPRTRVHVVASHFCAAAGDPTLFDSVGRGATRHDALAAEELPGLPECTYLAQRDLSDEQQYVLERRLAPRRVGNMLARPTLLLAPRVARETTQTAAPQLRESGAFVEKESAERLSREVQRRSRRGRAGIGGGGGHYGGAPNAAAAHTPARSPSLEFLAEQSACLYGLQPDDDGVVEVPAEALGDTRGHVTVVAVDGPSRAAGAVAVVGAGTRAPPQQGGYVAGLDAACLDTRLMPALPADAHVTEQRLVSLLGGGDTIEVDDIKTARVVTYDRLQDAYDLLHTLLAARSPAAAATLAKLDFLPRWASLDDAEREAKFSEFVSHELCFFLWRRDRPFFERVVRPHLAGRAPHLRTFFDDFLLGEPLGRYHAEPWRAERLNAAERVLLATRLPPGEARDVSRRAFADAQEALPADQQAFVERFETALRVKASVEAPEAPLEAEAAADGCGPPPPPAAAPRMAAAGRAPSPGAVGGARMMKSMAMPASLKRKAKKRSAAGAAREDLLCAMDEEECAEDIGPSSGSSDNDSYDDDDDDDDRFLAARDQVQQLYRPPATTKEYEETGYLVAGRQDTARLVRFNNFWANFAAHALGERAAEPFVSANLGEAAGTFEEAALALAVLDLPFEAAPPEVVSTGLRAGTKFAMRAAGPCVVFHKEMRDTPTVPSSVAVAQSYLDPADRYEEDRGEGRVDKYVDDEFLVNRVYHCRVVLTNVSSVTQRVSALLQIPEGSLPAGGVSGPAFRTDTRFVQIGAFSTQVIEYGFYFPAPGLFAHYPVHVSRRSAVVGHGRPRTINAVARLTAPPDLDSWKVVSQDGNDEQLLAFLSAKNLHRENLDLMLWRFSGGRRAETYTLYLRVLDTLRSRGLFRPSVWAYSLALGGPPEAVSEYLRASPRVAAQAGPYFAGSAYSCDAFDRLALTHLEYAPLINARAHRLRARGGAAPAGAPDDLPILNRQLKEQYRAFLEYLAHACGGVDDPRLPASHVMALVYYMLVQDRIDDALRLFGARLAGRSAAELGVSAMQLDLMAAYLDFYNEGGPSRAAGIAARYASYPVASWKRKFDQVARQAAEITGGGDGGDSGGDKRRRAAENDEQGADVERAMADAANADTEPLLEGEVIGGVLCIRHRNLDSCKVNLYQIDVESAFSARPFDANSSSRALFVAPNSSAEVELGGAAGGAVGVTQYALPASGNMYVEITGGSHLSSTVSHFSNSLSVQVVDRVGQLRVRDRSGAAVPRAYCKVYARKGGRAVFWKDGYTDLRGAFDYCSVSGENASSLSAVSGSFSVLVLDDELGAVVKEARKPAM